MTVLMPYREADDKLTALEGVTTRDFVDFANEVFRLSPEYIDKSRIITLPNGVKRELGNRNVCVQFCWSQEENQLKGVVAGIDTFEKKQNGKKSLRTSLLDFYESGEWEHVFILTIPLINNRTSFIEKDYSDLLGYLKVWYKHFPTKPVFAIGHADESEVYLHWHILFAGEVSYSRHKKILWLLEQEKNRKSR